MKRRAPSPTRAEPPETAARLGSVQVRLVVIWVCGAVMGLGTLLAQTVLGAYQDSAKEAWTLVAPLFVSVLSVLLGALTAGAIVQPQASEEKIVRRSYYRICLITSIGAVIIYIGSLWLQPVMIFSGVAASAIDALKLSMSWLLPIQGLVSVSLGGLLGASHAAKKT